MFLDVQLLSLLFLCLAVFALHFKQRGYVRIEDPATLLFGVFTLGTGIKLVYFIFFRAKKWPQTIEVIHDPVVMGKDESFLLPGMLFITLSVAAYCLGLWHNRAVRLPSVEPRVNDRLLYVASIAACIGAFLGVVFLLYMTDSFASGDFFAKRFNESPGGAVNRFVRFDYWIFKVASSIKYIFYLLLVVWVHRKERVAGSFYVLMIASLVLALLVPSVMGNRSYGFVIFLDLLILAGLCSRKRRLVTLSALMVICLAFTLATGSTRHTVASDPADRLIQKEGSFERQTAAAAVSEQRGGYERLEPERVERSLWFTQLVGNPTAQKIDVLMRGRYFLALFKTAHIVDDVPDRMPYLCGQSFYGWPFVLVPRSGWPEKPIFVEMAPKLADQVFLEPINNVPPGLVGEAWLNFGWFGLLVVAAVGSLIGLAFNSFLRMRHNALAQVVYAILLSRVSFIMINSSFGDGVLKFLIDAVPLVFALLLLLKFSGSTLALSQDKHAG